MDKGPPKNTLTPELPHCDRPIGTAAVKEPENRWWLSYNLSSPETLLKLFASRSGCLRMVDRNGGLAMHNQEEELAQSASCAAAPTSDAARSLRQTISWSPISPIPIPIPAATTSARRRAASCPAAGRPGGGIKMKRSEAQVLITLTDARTTEQLYVAEGAAKKTDVSFEAGGGGGSWAPSPPWPAAAIQHRHRQGDHGGLFQRLHRPRALHAE